MILNSTLKKLPEAKEAQFSGLWFFIKTVIWTIKLNLKLLPVIVVLRTLYNLYQSLEPLIHGFIWGIFIDSLINKDLSKINSTLVIYLIILGFSYVSGVINDRIDAIGKSVSNYKYRVYFSRIIASLGIPKLESSEIANKVYRVNESYNDIWSLTLKLSNLVSSGIAVAISLTVVLKIYPLFALIIFVLVLIRAIIHNRELKEDWLFTSIHTENKRIADGYIGSVLRVDNLKEILQTNSYNFFIKKFEDFNNWYHSKIVGLRVRKGVYDAVFEVLFTISFAYLITFFIKNYLGGLSTVGNLTFYIVSFRAYISSLKSFLAFITVVGEAKDRIKDAYELSHEEILNSENKISITDDSNLDINLNDVTFQYPNGSSPVINNLTLNIKKGEKIAIVGENGAGKTTLVSLILGFYPVSSGEIRIGDFDINDVKLETWYKKIGMLMQTFNAYDFMSLKNNLVLGENYKNRLEKINKLVGIDDIYLKYPFGIDQMLGSKYTNGISPSGGQWQKIAIARTLLRNTPLIVLDEPTSALDPMSEAKIFENLFEELNTKTVIIISHRFSTVKKADRIIVLHDGMIVEQGSHRELMSLDGMYAKSFNSQADSYKD